MPRTTKGVHCRKTADIDADTWCGGSSLWAMNRVSSLAPDDFEKVLSAGGKQRKVKGRKWGSKPARWRIVTDRPCGRCRVGFLADKRKKESRKVGRKKPGPKKKVVAVVIRDPEVSSQKTVGAETAAKPVAMPKQVAISDPTPDPNISRF